MTTVTNTERPDFFAELIQLRRTLEGAKQAGEIPALLADRLLAQARRLRELYDAEVLAAETETFNGAVTLE